MILDERLNDQLKTLNFEERKTKGICLELMAGTGRNLKLLAKYFGLIDAVEQVAAHVRAWPDSIGETKVSKFPQTVQRFRW